MKAEELNERLAPIALAMGVETLALDEEGAVTLVSDMVEILIEADEDSDSVFISALLASAPPMGATDILEQMLRANVLTQQTAGATLGMDRDLNVVVLSLRLSGAELRAHEPAFQERQSIGPSCSLKKGWTRHRHRPMRRIESICRPTAVELEA
jgi:hypothetical protein